MVSGGAGGGEETRDAAHQVGVEMRFEVGSAFAVDTAGHNRRSGPQHPHPMLFLFHFEVGFDVLCDILMSVAAVAGVAGGAGTLLGAAVPGGRLVGTRVN